MADKSMNISVIIGLNGYNKGLEVTISDDYISKLMKQANDPIKLEGLLRSVFKSTVDNLSDQIIKNIKVNPQHLLVVKDG